MTDARDPGHQPGKPGRRSAAVARVARVARATRVGRVARATRGIRRSRLVPGRGAADAGERVHNPARRPAGADALTPRQMIPALVTLIALGCGLAAMEAARVGSWDLALRLILVAAVADGVDGTVARRLGATSAMGKQLDSLSDIVAFGVAPAFLFATYYADAPDLARLGVVITFVAAGAYRLARFNAQPGNEMFQGLPITIAGALLAVAIAGPYSLGVVAGGTVAVALAFLMVTRQPFPMFNRWRLTLLPVVVIAVVVIAVWPTAEAVAVLAGLLLGSYVAWGLLHAVLGAFRHTSPPLEEIPDDA